jgi:multicomponent Na+:H+ antiporter subunit A
MVAGIIDHETGTRNIHILGGLAKKMPITATAGILAALSMAGLPPFQGFITKEIIYEANLHSGAYALWLILAGVLTFSCMIAVAFICGVRPFTSTRNETPKPPHEAPYTLWLGPIILASLGLLLGLWPQWIDHSLISPAITHLSGTPHTVKLSLWHGINTALVLSLLTLAIGFTIYKKRQMIRSIHLPRVPFHYLTPAHLYEIGLASLLKFATGLTQRVQHGYLRRYLFVFVITIVAGLLWAGIAIEAMQVPWQPKNSISWGEIIFVILMLQAALAACILKSRLMVVMALSFIGYGVALLYAFYGAPDLAITQVLVETLTLVLLLLLIYKLPKFTLKSSPYQKMRDAVIAITAGIGMAFMINHALTQESYPAISQWFSENSLLAKGRNVVNVIIVDFRALDTLGEITVLVLAALGVTALLKTQKKTAPPQS